MHMVNYIMKLQSAKMMDSKFFVTNGTCFIKVLPTPDEK